MDCFVVTRNAFVVNGIDCSLVHFESAAAEGHRVLKKHPHWKVFFRERGKAYTCVGFRVKVLHWNVFLQCY